MSGRIVLVAHCLLNFHSKVIGSGTSSNIKNIIITPLLKKGVGIIQLPCPEFTHGGLLRWGQTRSQYDNPFFVSHCTSLAKDVVNQIEEYLRCNYNVGPIIGINGSPSCGIDISCDGSWGGELGNNSGLDERLKTLRVTNCSGVFIKVMKDELEKRNIKIQFAGMDEEKPEASLDKILKLIDLKQEKEHSCIKQK